MSNKLYVGNLSFNTTEGDLENHFSAYGTVSEAALIQDKMTGKSRGFAFVTMASDSEAKAAAEGLDGKPLDGRNLTVNEARPREDRPGGGGGGGGGGGRNFGPDRKKFSGGGGGGRGRY